MFALGDLFAVGVHHEAVGQHGPERRGTVAGEGEQQRGLEPAAMLVAAFEIHVGLEGLVVDRQFPGVRAITAREEVPESIHTSRVSLDLATASAPVQLAGLTRAQSSAADCSNHTLEPCFSMRSAMLRMIARIQDRPAFGVVERGQRHAPGTLAADAPVGTRLHGALDAVDAPVGDPLTRSISDTAAARKVAAAGIAGGQS